MTNDDDLKTRALAAHYRFRQPGHPDPARTTVDGSGGHTYVTLRDQGGAVLCVYSLLGDGRLRALRRPPAELRKGEGR